ncbi:MAG TPA: sigma-70 family RNA polymerase sigma factor [Solirubrobacteraceae bacterium]|nr:sigma-70 family RNA polymerase sigma factor [Solirubrobacteraceae bacterium]
MSSTREVVSMAPVAGGMKTDVRMLRIVPRTEAPDEQMTQLVSQAVRRAKEGDHEAVGFLYARYADNVFGYVRSILHDSHDAEDVTQQVFAKLTHVIGKYEERDGPFFAWVMRVARNLAVDHPRHQRMIPVEEVRTTTEDGADPVNDRRLSEDLREALSRQPRDRTSARSCGCATSRGSPRRK